jgi:hypothetical protein
MTNSVSTPPADAVLVDGILGRIARELGMMLGHELVLDGARVERATSRPAGAGSIHVSFKLGFAAADGTERFGSLLVPLPDAITMAGYLLMMADEAVAARREERTLDTPLKNAMLEIGNMLASAAGSVLTELGLARWSVRSVGCQGVRDGIRPAFPYVEGSELVVGRAAARFEPFPACEHVLILPVLD